MDSHKKYQVFLVPQVLKSSGNADDAAGTQQHCLYQLQTAHRKRYPYFWLPTVQHHKAIISLWKLNLSANMLSQYVILTENTKSYPTLADFFA